MYLSAVIIINFLAFPDVKENELDDWDEFIVLACDGLSLLEVINRRDLGLPNQRTSHRICETGNRRTTRTRAPRRF